MIPTYCIKPFDTCLYFIQFLFDNYNCLTLVNVPNKEKTKKYKNIST